MKEKIALITDSTCDIPKEKLKELSIKLLPLKIIYSDREYNDRIDITPEEIYQNFDQEIPSTSMPSPHKAKETFLKLKEEGFTHVIAIHISSGLSGTYNMVKMISQEINDLTIEVIDSNALSMKLGSIVLYAAQLIKKGLDFKQILSKIDEKIDNVDIFFVVETLKYLTTGGRIGKVAGTIGEFLNIKPIISINDDGEYYTYKKSRGRKRSINALYKIVKEKIKDKTSHVDIMHAAAEEEAKKLQKKIAQLDNVKETYIGQIGPGLVVHAGPGLLGVCISEIADS